MTAALVAVVIARLAAMIPSGELAYLAGNPDPIARAVERPVGYNVAAVVIAA